jgi:hypothetical protein
MLIGAGAFALALVADLLLARAAWAAVQDVAAGAMRDDRSASRPRA